MENDQRVIEIREELQRLSDLKKNGSKIDVSNFLRMLGVEERIVNNPNPNNLGMGLDFDRYILGMANANIKINADGSVSLNTDIGNTYLVQEGKNVGGIEISVFVKNGEFHMGTTYKKDNFHGVNNQFDLIIVPYGNDYSIRSRVSEYSLGREYNNSSQKYEIQGRGVSTITDYDKDGIERNQSIVSYANNPDVVVSDYNGIGLNDIRNQAYFTRDWTYGNKELEHIVPSMSCANKNTPFFCGEIMLRRMESIDKVQSGRWNSENKQWDFKYHLSLTGEHNMSMLRNNSWGFDSEEELNDIRQERFEDGWYDRKISEYKQMGVTNHTDRVIANLLEQEKLKLEETKGRSL